MKNEEEDYDKDFNDWFDYFRKLFPEDLMDEYEPSQEISSFYSGIYSKIMSELTPQARKLAYRQYPNLETETRPTLMGRINSIIEDIGKSFLINLFTLLYDERQGVNLREKYPELDEWTEEYARPYDPLKILKEVFADAPWLTDEQKQKMIDEALEEVNPKEVRKAEFRGLIQEIVLRHYPQVENLSAEGWIVYAYHLDMEYAEYRFDIEFFHSFIECGLAEEDLKLSGAEIHDKIMKFYNEKYSKIWTEGESPAPQ